MVTLPAMLALRDTLSLALIDTISSDRRVDNDKMSGDRIEPIRRAMASSSLIRMFTASSITTGSVFGPLTPPDNITFPLNVTVPNTSKFVKTFVPRVVLCESIVSARLLSRVKCPRFA